MEKYSSSCNRGYEDLERNTKNAPTNSDISKVLCDLVKQQSAPDIDLDVFDGNHLQYHYFITMFYEMVEKRIDDPSGRITCILKYTRGDAKEMI